MIFNIVVESQRPANKRRKRKGSQSGGAANNTPPVPNKKRSPGPNFSLASQVTSTHIHYSNWSVCKLFSTLVIA